ncbi:hypothetical protein LCGC14_2871780, partial [marine sediment metagenome]
MAIHFTNVADKLTFANVQGAQGQTQTFSCWCYCDAITTSEVIFSIMNAGGPETTGLLFYLFSSNRDIQFYIYTSGTACYRKTNTAVFNTGEWFHLLLTWNGSLTATNIHIYINNSEPGYATTQNSGGTATICDGTWNTGSWPEENLPLDGKIANVGWWDRVLSASERTILSKGYTPRHIMKGLKFAPD